MGVLELGGWDVAEARVKPTSVVPVDPAGGHVFDVRDRLVRAGVEVRRADAFGLVEAVHGLHEGVIVRVPDRPDRGGDAVERESLRVGDRGVPGAGVAVRSQLPRRDRVALPAAFPQWSRPIADDSGHAGLFGLLDTVIANLYRIRVSPFSINRDVQLPAKRLELIDCSRTIHISPDQ